MGYVAVESEAVLSLQSDAKVTDIAIFGKKRRLIGPSAKRRVGSAGVVMQCTSRIELS